MAKKQANGRKPSGAAGMATIEEAPELDRDAAEVGPEESADADAQTRKTERATKAKAEQRVNDHVSLGDIRKAAAFANSVGGLDKAIALLQILKVAKEVQ
jgi:hypothetical protein